MADFHKSKRVLEAPSAMLPKSKHKRIPLEATEGMRRYKANSTGKGGDGAWMAPREHTATSRVRYETF